MFENSISKDSYHILCVIYKVYLQRKKSGSPKATAGFFDDYDVFRKDYAPKIHADDMYSAMTELEANDLITLYIDGSFELTNDAIIKMENRFSNNLSKVMDYISKIPFI